MSEHNTIPPVAHQVSLVLHTAVDFGRKAGIGLAVIQRAATDAAGSSFLSSKEQKHGIERGQIGAKNVATPERAHMYAFVLALGLARSTLKQASTSARIKVQSITVLCNLPTVVELISRHRAHGPKSIDSIMSADDRSMIRRVLTSMKRISQHDVQVSIAHDGEEGSAAETARAKMMAHHRKKKACRRRRHERRVMSAYARAADDEEEDGVSGEEDNEMGDD